LGSSNRREYLKEYGKRYRLKNKKNINERMKKYRIEHKEEIYERDKQYRENNKEKLAEYFKQYRQSHKKQLREKGIQYYYNNREKMLKYSKQWQKDNPERVAIWKKRLYDKRRKLIDDYKLSKGCSVCGYNKYPAVLEFHHPNNDKEFIVAKLLQHKLETLKKEMGKCIILCANCHAELHAKERRGE